MKVDKSLTQTLAKHARIASALDGGITETRMRVSKTSENIIIRLKNPGIEAEAYHVEVKNHLLIIYTALGFYTDKGEDWIIPTFYKTIPLWDGVKESDIEAIYKDGELSIYLPHNNEGTDKIMDAIK